MSAEDPRNGHRPNLELNFHRSNGPVDQMIEELIQTAGGIQRPAIVREMLLAALKAGQEDDGQLDLKLMNTALKEMRYTAKVFGPYRHRLKVTVFGSARTSKSAPLYQLAQKLGSELANTGYMVITGGGPGIMQPVNEGAGPNSSFGVNIRLPFEQKPNPVLDGNPKNIFYKYFFNRKVAFLKEAQAVVLFPGGFGTLDEAMETLTLVQTGKHVPIPLVLIDEPGGVYWDRWFAFINQNLADTGNIDQADLSLWRQVDNTADALAEIKHFYRRFHSLRYVDDQLVIRLLEALSDKQVSGLEQQFSKILTAGGHISQTEPLPIEIKEEDLIELPRLLIDFNFSSFGRLRELIDAINAI